MRPFKVGDRVRVYCGNRRLVGAEGTVKSLCGHNDLMYVQIDYPGDSVDTPLVHAKQCRRLVKRKKRPEIPKTEVTHKDTIEFIKGVNRIRNSQSENDTRKLETVPVDCKKWNGMSGDLGRMVYCINFLLACERERRWK